MITKVEKSTKHTSDSDKKSTKLWESSVKLASSSAKLKAKSSSSKASTNNELGKGQKRPEGDSRSARQIINESNLLKNLGNQNGVKDNLKKQVGDFEKDADAAYRAVKVLEHVVSVDENGKMLSGYDALGKNNSSIDGFTKDGEAEHGTEAGRLQDFGKFGYSSLRGELVKSDLSANAKRPDGDKRSAKEIIDSSPLLKNLGNQSGVKDKLKKQVGDFNSDADAAYRATQVLKHVVSFDENGKELTGKLSINKDNDKIDGFTKDGDARHGTEAGRLQDFGKFGFNSLKGELFSVKDRIHTNKAAPPKEPKDVQSLREKYEIPSFGAEGLMDMELVNHKTVGSQTAESFVNGIRDDIKSGKLKENSDEAKLVNFMEGQAALSDGYELHGYVESVNNMDASSNSTYRRTNVKPAKLSGKDVKDIVDEKKLAKQISILMGKDDIKRRYDKELQKNISTLPGEQLKEVREQVFPALFKQHTREANTKFEEYVIAMNDSGDPQKQKIAELDVDRYFESLRILEPDSYTARRQAFDQNMMTHQLNTYVENPDKVSSKNSQTGLTSTLSIIKSGLSTATGVMDKGDKTYDLYKKMKDEVDILDGHIKHLTPDENKKISAALHLATISGDPNAIDKVVDNQLKGLANNREATAGSLKKFLHSASSSGSLGAMNGTVSLVSAAMQLANGGKGMTDDQKIAATRDLIGGLSSTNDFLKFGSNLAEIAGGRHSYDPAVDIDGKRQPKIKATQWLGMLDDNFPDLWNKQKIAKSDALTDAISERVKASSDTLKHLDVGNLSAEGVKEYDKTVQALGEKMGVRDIPGHAGDLKTNSFAEAAGRSFLRFMGGSALDVTGGVMDIVSGARKLRDAKSDLQKVDAAFSLGSGISGTGTAISNTVAMFAPKGAHLAAALSGDVATTVVRGLAIGARIAGPIFSVAGVIFGIAGTLIAEAVQHAKLQKITDSEGKFFKNLADSGVTHENWGDKLEYARYATYMYGSRDTPDDKSMFEFQADEWKHFKEAEGRRGSSLSRLAPYLHKDGDPQNENLWKKFLAGGTNLSSRNGLNSNTDDWRPWSDTDLNAGRTK
ncbi:hypothetical protein SAMN03159512_02976 [Pseudomonas sp. NFR09]|uniref:hypothetical protein n=1 Tax=Pseudomonas sp. NFR09 TaxID=1566249 RepID=UPI0008C42291|nr:hypothetical protein [Pseudomonas sp. NFR09]SET64448.1 hypothetical protein SAMN03159512_02976 [Pseudomonas sp. NFR09]